MSAPAPASAGRFDAVVVGSGFAGSILARVLARRGLSVALVERGEHPRFALGESSTPLAALSLERLAVRWDLSDLHHLAAWGRWRRRLPELRCGLKRGFTFYRHSEGRPYANGPENEARLLVAASPRDEIADTHWLRADVDHHLVRRAVAEGVTYLDRTRLDAAERGDAGWRLAGERDGRRIAIEAGYVVDGTGRGGFLAEPDLAEGDSTVETASPSPGGIDPDALARPGFTSRLLFAHFEGLAPFPEAAREGGAVFPPGPYPDERAAVHHLLGDAWLYVLPFDHGVASCGAVLYGRSPEKVSDLAPAEEWSRLLARLPTLAATFAEARPLAPVGRVEALPYRRARAAGEGWALLPHTHAFFDPLFSTGIAWSLLAVERLSAVVAGEASGEAYARLLAAEADWIGDLLRASRAALGDFTAFAAVAGLYFTAASFAEARGRLVPVPESGPEAGWEGFLGAGDPVLGEAPGEAAERLEAGSGTPTAAETSAFRDWLAQRVASRNVAGLFDPARRNLYPVDLDALVANAALFGLTAEEVRRQLPR